MRAPVWHLVLVVTFTATSVVLTGAAARIDLPSHSGYQGDDLQTIRAYVSSINEYVAQGNADVLPDAESQDIIGLKSLRMTYPQLEYRLAELGGGNGMVTASIEVQPGQADLPGWIAPSTRPSAMHIPVGFRIEHRAIVDQTGRLDDALTAFAGMVENGRQFHVNTPSHLILFKLLIDASGESPNYVALPGPGVYVIDTGTIEVLGNGMTEIVELRGVSSRVIEPGGTAKAIAGDTIIVPAGHAVVVPEPDDPASILSVAAIPAESRSKLFERDGDSLPGTDPQATLRIVPPGVQQVWFGSAEVLRRSESTLQAGFIELQVGWLNVPPGVEITLDCGPENLLLYPIDHSERIESTATVDGIRVRNNGLDSVRIFVARLA